MDKAKQTSDAAQGAIGVKTSVSLESSIKKTTGFAKKDASGQTQSSQRGKDNG